MYAISTAVCRIAKSIPKKINNIFKLFSKSYWTSNIHKKIQISSYYFSILDRYIDGLSMKLFLRTRSNTKNYFSQINPNRVYKCIFKMTINNIHYT